MPQSRKSQVSLADTPYYHCVSRCVRRAFLCGEDKVTGKSFEHRREWVEEKLLFLSQVFSIDVCAYAVMHNHTHIVLHVDESRAQTWNSKEVLTRWHQLFKGTLLTQRYVSEVTLTGSELVTLEETVHIYRERLTNISWFMRVLNEGIARAANKEDNCTGRFWEGRFKSQALLDEAALLSCMAYVDLNPIRARIASTPESSEYTSIKARVQAVLQHQQPQTLFPFKTNETQDNQKGLSFPLRDYIELVEVTGRCIRHNKQGHIDNQLPTILEHLNITEENWLVMSTQFEEVFKGSVGRELSLEKYCESRGRISHNLNACRRLFA